MNLKNLSPAVTDTTLPAQLPIDWYINADIYAIEQQFLFSHAPRYVGHTLMVPNPNDYYTIDWMGHGKALVNCAGEVSLINNVCRHRQAIMLTGAGSTSHIVCPLHRWTYNLDGELIGAPKFEKNPCLHLAKTPLINWHGLLFESPCNISLVLNQLNNASYFDFSDYRFNTAQTTHYDFNWKTFIEVYLEDYHVSPAHAGLDQFVNCDVLDWQFGEHFSLQTVGYKPLPETHASATYARWHQVANQYASEQQNTPEHGAIWFVFYPFLMIEWYPNVLVVSHLIPTGVDSCTNVVEFYYPEAIALFEPEYMAVQQAAYQETAREDEVICQRMHQGRKALGQFKQDERGPYLHPLETGLAHFHQWYRQQLAPHLTDAGLS